MKKKLNVLDIHVNNMNFIILDKELNKGYNYYFYKKGRTLYWKKIEHSFYPNGSYWKNKGFKSEFFLYIDNILSLCTFHGRDTFEYVSDCDYCNGYNSKKIAFSNYLHDYNLICLKCLKKHGSLKKKILKQKQLSFW